MSHHVTFNDLPAGGEKFEPAKGAKLINTLGIVGVLGLIGSIIFFFTDKDNFAYSWLFALFFSFTFVVGGCFWVLLHNASNSGWGVSIRRLWEQLSALALPLAILASPLLIPSVQENLWEWMDHHRHAAHVAHEQGGTIQEALTADHHSVLAAKYGYLNITFWYIRFVFFFGVLWFIGWLSRGRSVRQDQDGNIGHTIRLRQYASIFLFPFALTVTFAAVDWLMTLDYNWFSTMWGVYIFAGSAWASMALTMLLVTWLRSLGYLQKVVSMEHYHLMGKLLFAFTVFWAYIAFSQYFLIWYANITEETRFYLTRNTEAWRWVSIFIVIGHFIAPFALLLSQDRKKKPVTISLVCAWVIFMHLVDMYWNVIPERGPSLGKGWWVPHAWLGDIVALAAFVGILGFLYLRSLSRYSLYPCRDPRLLESANVTN
jgi:hypothetical protein